jgi:WhiB family redox-sensing transcriptional regulator
VTTNDQQPEPTRKMPSPQGPNSPSAMRVTWRNSAACLDEDPDLFFPVGNMGPARHWTDDAKAICRQCEVVETCLEWAMGSGQMTGVFGGLSEDERRSLKRRNARARHAG